MLQKNYQRNMSIIEGIFTFAKRTCPNSHLSKRDFFNYFYQNDLILPPDNAKHFTYPISTFDAVEENFTASNKEREEDEEEFLEKEDESSWEEQLYKAEKIVREANSLGFLNGNHAVHNLALLIRHSELGDDFIMI